MRQGDESRDERSCTDQFGVIRWCATMRRLAIAISVVLLCAAVLGAQPGGAAHHIALQGDDYADLAPLKRLLTGVRIVQLGENGHGAAESMVARARIARFLHRELGFGVLAFESSLFLCHLADTAASERPAQRTLTSSLIGVWHTHQMLPLFDYLRETRRTPSPLRLAGFDVQPIGTNRKERPSFFANLVAIVDAEYAKTVHAMDAEFFAAYDKGASVRRSYLRANSASLEARYDALAAFLEEHMATLQQRAGPEGPLVAAQEARSAAAYVRFQTASDMQAYTELRDRGMFDNLRFLAERLFPNQKIIVWGHNYHLRHDNVAIPAVTEIFPGVSAHTMGTWSKKHFGNQVFTIGEYAFKGEAVDNSRTPFAVPAPGPESLEQRLHDVSGGRAAIVELTTSGAPAWARARLSARYNGQHEQMLTPRDQFDALLFLPRISPPRFLY